MMKGSREKERKRESEQKEWGKREVKSTSLYICKVCV